MNKKFGKVNEDKSITYAPDAVKIITTHTYEYDDYDEYDEDGNPIGEPIHHEETYNTEKKIFPPSAEDYKNAFNGPWLPNEVTEPVIPEGMKIVSEEWSTDGIKNTVEYKYEKVMRTFSKLKLEMALFNIGKLSKLDEFIDSETIKNEFGQEMPLRRAYETANEFSEGHPMFAPYLKKAQEYLEIDDATCENILKNSVLTIDINKYM